AFYIMKYELSQHAYVDFLNTLTNAQQTTRSVIPPTAGAGIYYTGNTSEPSPWRNWIRVRIPQANAPAVYGLWYKKTSVDAWDQEKNAGNVAMCNMGWSDIAAYLSWSGLRPLSEWEYEKACRGPQTSLENEFAWGNTSYTYVPPGNGDIVDLNLSTEVAPAGTNLVPMYSSMYNFPMRVGCFATNASTRIQAGAGYYGALNLSDNVTELYVNLSTKQGLEFSGEHGSGEINGNGDAEVKNWPDAISNSDNRAYGVGAKGYNYVSNSGAEGSDLRYARVSCRLAMETRYADRYWFLGCRGGRTAPNN
ncbi:MAG: SUMF1/EgtB/PvdO family nonheme iron enzyme, partial [Bacteroidales bacterium]